MHGVHEDLLGKLLSTDPKLLLPKGTVNGILLKENVAELSNLKRCTETRTVR